MILDEATKYIMTLLPSITAVVSVIASMVVTLKKFKDLTETSKSQVFELQELCKELIEENKQLKKEIKVKISRIEETEKIIKRRK